MTEQTHEVERVNLLKVSAANREKYENSRGRFDDRVAYCELCGRKMSQKPGARWLVEVGVDGFEFGTTNETESQGFWLLGSECRKQFPNAVQEK
jgi:hypothetical protein